MSEGSACVDPGAHKDPIVAAITRAQGPQGHEKAIPEGVILVWRTRKSASP